MALTLQSFVQMIYDYLPYLRAPDAQIIFGQQQSLGLSISGGGKNPLINLILVRGIWFQESM